MKGIAKFLIFFFLCNMLGGVAYAKDDTNNQRTSASDNQEFQTLKSYGIVDDSLYNNEKVNREDCITAIMKLIGANSKLEEGYKNSSIDGVMFLDAGGCYILEAEFERIAIGEPAEDTPLAGNYFHPDRDVTVKEATTFMTRCLVNLGETYEVISKVDLNATFNIAKEIGLIQKTDIFYDKGENTLKPDEFCTLLYRMLYMPRYKYCGNDFPSCGKIDASATTRYIDCLKKINN
jgi:hypothetical protein